MTVTFFVQVDKSDTGVYTCEIENEHGSTKATIKVLVIGKHDIQHSTPILCKLRNTEMYKRCHELLTSFHSFDDFVKHFD